MPNPPEIPDGVTLYTILPTVDTRFSPVLHIECLSDNKIYICHAAYPSLEMMSRSVIDLSLIHLGECLLKLAMDLVDQREDLIDFYNDIVKWAKLESSFPKFTKGNTSYVE